MSHWGMRVFRHAGSVAALGLSSMLTAHAEPIYLKCYNTAFQRDDLHTVDVLANTVDGNQATITPTAFRWAQKNDNGSITNYTVDRTTGTLTFQATIPGVGVTGVVTEACTAGGAPATKF